MQETKIIKGTSGREYVCRKIVARYPGKCGRCGSELLGTEIWYAQGLQINHVSCPAVSPAPAAAPMPHMPQPAARSVRKNSRAQQCNSCGHTVPVGQGELIYVDEDDEGSHGFQSGWLVYHLDETVCNANRAAEKAAAERRQALRAEHTALVQLIQAGELPEGIHVPEGERVLDTQNIYGGGDWFVVAVSSVVAGDPATYIWYVRNNGFDGADWSRNNVRTGGAGAIGWRIPYDSVIADRIRKLAEEY